VGTWACNNLHQKKGRQETVSYGGRGVCLVGNSFDLLKKADLGNWSLITTLKKRFLRTAGGELGDENWEEMRRFGFRARGTETNRGGEPGNNKRGDQRGIRLFVKFYTRGGAKQGNHARKSKTSIVTWEPRKRIRVPRRTLGGIRQEKRS